MTKAIQFNDDQRTQIAQGAMNSLGLDETAAAAYVENIEKTGDLEVFTGGSLINYSHLQNADKTFKTIGADKEKDIEDLTIEEAFPGIKKDEMFTYEKVILEGYNNDFVCFDIHYRGTPEEPGITIGMDKAEGGSANGTVMKTKISHLNTQVAADFACHYMASLNDREFPLNMPIYTLKPLEVTGESGETYNPLVCVADQNGPLYIHNPNNRYAQNDPSYHIPRGEEGRARKAEIMATAGNPINPKDGQPKAKGAITDLDYLKNNISGFREKGVEIPQQHMQLLTDAVQYRMDHDITFPEYEEAKITALNAFVTASQEHNAQFANPANDDMMGPAEQKAAPAGP